MDTNTFCSFLNKLLRNISNSYHVQLAFSLSFYYGHCPQPHAQFAELDFQSRDYLFFKLRRISFITHASYVDIKRTRTNLNKKYCEPCKILLKSICFKKMLGTSLSFIETVHTKHVVYFLSFKHQLFDSLPQWILPENSVLPIIPLAISDFVIM